MIVFDSVAPVFFIIAVGAFLTHLRFFPPLFSPGLNKLTYWVALPCLLFDKITSSTLNWTPVSNILVVFFAASIVATFIGFFYAKYVLCVSGSSLGAFSQACFRGNLAYVGLPIIASLSTSLGNNNFESSSIAIQALAPIVPIYSISAVFLLLYTKERMSLAALKRITVEIIRNPLIISCILGLCASYLGIVMPTALNRSVQTIADAALPLALFSLGSTFIQMPISGAIWPAFNAAIIKIGLCPLLGYFIASTIGLNDTELRIALIYLASPSAIASFVLADQLGSDTQLSVNTVILSSLMSILSLSVVIMLCG